MLLGLETIRNPNASKSDREAVVDVTHIKWLEEETQWCTAYPSFYYFFFTDAVFKINTQYELLIPSSLVFFFFFAWGFRLSSLCLGFARWQPSIFIAKARRPGENAHTHTGRTSAYKGHRLRSWTHDLLAEGRECKLLYHSGCSKSQLAQRWFYEEGRVH